MKGDKGEWQILLTNSSEIGRVKQSEEWKKKDVFMVTVIKFFNVEMYCNVNKLVLESPDSCYSRSA